MAGRRRNLPEIAELLGNERHWSEENFFLFRERCNELTIENPADCLELALHGPALAERAGRSSKRPAYLLHVAYTLLGDAYRLTGSFTQAEHTFNEALELADSLSDLETTDLRRRIASLRKDQQRFEEALTLIDEVMQTYRIHGDLTERHFLGHCYLVRGVIQHERGRPDLAALDLTTALHHIDLKEHSRLYYSAIHNLAVALVDCKNHDALAKALELLETARKKIRIRGRHLAKFKLRWLQGKICIRFGSTRQGERYLWAARDGLAEMGAPYEVALIGLDLAELCLLEGEPLEVIAKLSSETYELFRRLSSDEKTMATLLLWCEAAGQGALSEDVLRHVRDGIVERVRVVV